ncbi:MULTISPECIES: hypothetical protein [unclassified Fusibacter]|uniref:hypothetical protein n=1 Tax=unclassified Fusibacter TaxID=2624464 RepID=UPI0010118762|nr:MULTISPECIES: hypothetical protein [unclassified Fusibacter]MCK8059768.1 hypothetical protein [Fusibacter sp. A2]NPE21569.1 hypothetical protein [Fusibacter sp. A1]RXV61977.1 hypothetical protein DWB64_06985 [Fusibacter sp. A1]
MKVFRSIFTEVRYQIKVSSPEYLSRIIPCLLFFGLLVYMLGFYNVFLTMIPILLAFGIGVVVSLI